MSVDLKFDGLKELRESLRRLPEELAGEAGHIVEGTANAANGAIRRAYPHGPTGKLIAGVTTTHLNAGKVAAGAIVKSTARHSHLFERGTVPRKTRRGAGRGSMPPAPPGEAMVPIVVRARREMYRQLIELLVRNGLTVEGQP